MRIFRPALVLIIFSKLALGAESSEPPKGYRATDVTRKCVNTYEIRDTRVLRDGSILFRVQGNTYYLNRPVRGCPGLAIEQSFGYTVHGIPELCHGDAIRVLDGSGTGAGCILGAFEKLEKRYD